MYDHSSVFIVGLLLLALIAGSEVGFRVGKVFHKATDEQTKGQINAIQGSILGVLALLLGFTFSLSLQRYDTRSEAVTNEANAIGTTMLRAALLPESVREDTQRLISKYLELRINAGGVSLDQDEERAAVVAESDAVLQMLWANARQAAAESPNPVTTGLFIQALNEQIDAFGSRDAALGRHVPEPVLFLLFGTLIMTAALVGYSSGVTGHRAAFAAYILLLLIVLLVFLVIDLDRPRRGLIEVSQQGLVDLQSHILFVGGQAVQSR